MAESLGLGKTSRYSDFYQEPIDHLLTPIKGFDDRPLLQLTGAIESVAHCFYEIHDYVNVALTNCENPREGLSQQESAAIQLYTMEFSHGKSLYSVLNEALRSEVRDNLKPWFPYLQLLLGGLQKLPNQAIRIWRGIRSVDLSEKYQTGTRFAWWGVSSCTVDMKILESSKFLGKTGLRTLFSIDCINGKSIALHSIFGRTENEFILMPGSYFEVTGQLNLAQDLYIIELKEIKPPMTLVKYPQIPMKPLADPTKIPRIPTILYNAKWLQNGDTIIKGLASPYGVAFDPKTEMIFVANYFNHSVTASKLGSNKTVVVAGGQGRGQGLHQLDRPTNVLIDHQTRSLIIADCENRRVMRWSLSVGTTQGEVIIDNIACHGLAMDNDGHLYVSDISKNEVLRYPKGEKRGTRVAGGNDRGDGPHQLNYPAYVAVDVQGSVYISDNWNHRVVKWTKGAKEGIIVAGGYGLGTQNNQLHYPEGIFIDTNGSIYVSDHFNNRITRWWREESKADVILRVARPRGLCFDMKNNLYVVDDANHSVLRFLQA